MNLIVFDNYNIKIKIFYFVVAYYYINTSIFINLYTFLAFIHFCVCIFDCNLVNIRGVKYLFCKYPRISCISALSLIFDMFHINFYIVIFVHLMIIKFVSLLK